MCRFVAYLGENILLKDVLVTPIDSLVKQSLYAKESEIRTNGDGFGIGWYVPEISPFPALFVSVLPAWNDINLLHLTEKTKSCCFFGHVRAASGGSVANYNCHPFIYKQWMLMHNGEISHFIDIKRDLCNLLDQDIYSWIKGQTDSEHLFALFIQLAKNKDLTKLNVVMEVLEETFKTIDRLLSAVNRPNNSYLNVCLSDGQRLIASRYCVDKDTTPESLHYFIGHTLSKKTSGLIASEMLTDLSEWQSVTPDHFVCIEKDHTVSLKKIKVF